LLGGLPTRPFRNGVSEPFSSWFGCVGRQGFSLITR
jgi:hypothetical protein